MSRSISIAKLVIAHQILNCLTCPQLSNCQLTKEFTRLSIENKLDIYSLELIKGCGNFGNLMKAFNNKDGKFVSDLLKRYLSKKLKSKTSVFNEGLIINLNGYSLAIPNNDKINERRIFIGRYRNNGGDYILELESVSNEYFDYLIKLVSHIVPRDEYSLNELIKARERFLRNFIEDDNLIRSLVLSTFNLGELSPLINDDVEDIFVTSDSIYIHHTEYGLCKVINVNSQHVARQLLKLANMSGIRVSVDNPSGKFSLDLMGRKLRITVDRWPLTEGIAVHIRLHKRPFSIVDLINLGTIDAVNAAKLIISLYRGSHLIIAGPPGSGKTTLLNALDATLPIKLRRIYIDETDESLDLPVPSVKVKALISKVDEVLKSLHRGYGILIIGELREKEHFEALIHGINSGMQVMGTTHAVNRESLTSRLRAFGINDLVNLDSFILIFMNKEGHIRKVINILYPNSINDDNIISELASFLRNARCEDAFECIIRINEFMKDHGFEV